MELLERYVQQVGRFLPGRDRDDIQNELRSLLLDKLEDRVADSALADAELADASADDASADDVVALLEEMGSPRQVAASYSGERYLVGPALYPMLLQVLRIGLVVYVIVHVVLLVFVAADMSLVRLFEAALDSLGSILGFFGATVLVFAILEWQDVKINPIEPEWDPRSLPAADRLGRVEPVGLFVGLAFNLVFLSLAFYFWRLGGVAYVANWPSEATVLPVSRRLLFASGGIIALQIITDLCVFLRRRWEVSTRLVRSVLDVAGVFAVFSILQEVMSVVSGMATPFSGLASLARWGFRGLLVLVVAVTVFDGAKKVYKLIPNLWKVSAVERDS
ncbi:MAG: hypothetical protein MUQ30_06395 [Anaerolineae bacterium]|nr:hypothetical protein [Anaerolineae bacterium]